MSSSLNEKLSLAQLLKSDDIIINILPLKKGLFKKHVEYEVRSSKFNSQVIFNSMSLFLSENITFFQVVRRYSDFMTFHEILLCRFPNRILPPLPPQTFSALVKGVDSDFAEARRKGLLRWLRILSSHPIVCMDPALSVRACRNFKNMCM